MNLINSILLLLPAALQCWLASILFQGRLHRTFGFFSIYTVTSIIALILRFAVQSNYIFYFYIYWVTEAFYVVLGLLAILESFPLTFRSFARVKRFRQILWFVVGLMALLAVLHAIFVGTSQAGPPIKFIAPLEIGVQYIQGAVFVLFVLMAIFYHVPWRRHAFGMVFGFGLLACASLAATLLRSEFGTHFKFMFTYMPGVVYVFAVLIWLLTFLKPEPPDPLDELKSPLSPEEVIRRLRN